MEVNFMQTQVKAWGNSQGIRLPKDILQEANVEINDMLEVKVSDGMIMLVKTFRPPSAKSLPLPDQGHEHISR